MGSISRFASDLLTAPRILALDGWKALLRILARFLAWWRRIHGMGSSVPGQGKPHRYSRCVPMTHPAFKVPDPLIYSQDYLMGLGFAVTWDNPDIVLKANSAVVPSSALEPDTEYEIVARVWNNSLDAPVVDLPVSFSYLAFGIGTTSYPITEPGKPVHITLGVKGGPNHPAFAVAKWRTPKPPGHYCIRVRLDPSDDANYGNNLGQENTQVGRPHSPAEFAFLLRNNTPKQETVRFTTDAYRLPEPPPCGPTGTAAFDPSAHQASHYPIPPGWAVNISPHSPVLQPGQEQQIAVKITPLQGFKGTRAFNINAFVSWGFLGGVTLYVED